MRSFTAALMRTGIITSVCIASFAAEAAGQSGVIAPEDLAKRAEVVAVGKVSALVSQWNADHSRIYTTVTLSVDQYLKGGSAAGALTLVVAGGEVDGVGEVYSHTAAFRRDENVLVFAEKDRQGNLRVSHGQQGKFDVTKDALSGKAFVGTRSMEDIAGAVRAAIGLSTQKQ